MLNKSQHGVDVGSFTEIYTASNKFIGQNKKLRLEWLKIYSFRYKRCVQIGYTVDRNLV